MYLSLKSSSGAGRQSETFRQGALCALLLHTGEHSPPLLQLHPRGNTGPVSIHSFLSKTFEHAVYNQLSSYLSENDLPDPNQSGFRTGLSTETARSLGAARDSSKLSVLILLYLSSTFDTVNHQILLSTLA